MFRRSTAAGSPRIAGEPDEQRGQHEADEEHWQPASEDAYGEPSGGRHCDDAEEKFIHVDLLLPGE